MSIRRFFRRQREDSDLAQEIQAHITHEIDENIARGASREEATRQAYLKFGNPQLVREDVWQWNTVEFLDSIGRDLRFAVRTLRQKPGFLVVALLTLGLGIGATTAMFTVINGVLLKPLSFSDPDKLVSVHGQDNTWTTKIWGQQNVAYPDFLDCRHESRTLDIAGHMYNPATASWPGQAEYADRREISANLFSVLGVKMLLGRAFLPEEDQAGGTPVAILGYSFWQRHFAGSPAAIGMRLNVDVTTYTVVGIAPADFRLYEQEPEVLTPLGQDTAAWLHKRAPHPIGVVARLQGGATLAQAQEELGLLGRNLAAQYPDTNAGRSFKAEQLRLDVGDVGATLWLLLGAVGLVLLIACTNVASLLLARAVSREREFALRVALGAGRGRLIRLCLTESMLLGLCGGVLGVAIAAYGVKPFVHFWPGSLPRAEEIHMDWRVLLFALTVSLFSGFLFGLAPALRAPVRNLEQVLRAGARTLTRSSRRLHGAFVVSELALAVVLLVSAGMLGRTLLRLYSLDPGVDIHNVLTARIALSPAVLAKPERTRAAWKELLDRASHVPGVQAVALVDTVPMRQGNNPLPYWNSAALPPEKDMPLVLTNCVTPDYLKVMGIPLLRGRFINEQDRLNNENEMVIVIDDVLAQHAFGGQDAVGKLLWVPDMSKKPLKVVGVVGHVRYWGLAGDDQATIRAQLYYAFDQIWDVWVRRWSEHMSVAVRTGVPPLNVLDTLRHAVRGDTGDQVLYQVHTLEDLASASVARQRLLVFLFGIFAALALLLACVGIYGVLSYLTSRRTSEIGVRMALGATARDVIRLVLRQSVGMILIGVGIGIVAALASGRVLLHVVDGMQPTEPLTLAMMISLLMAAALMASFVPARRASRLDAVHALRSE
ncbi:MAG TPA: ABC transporter permease [Candidatus Angelobacter sp.]